MEAPDPLLSALAEVRRRQIVHAMFSEETKDIC